MVIFFRRLHGRPSSAEARSRECRTHFETPPSTCASFSRTSERSELNPPRLAACKSNDEWCLLICERHCEQATQPRRRHASRPGPRLPPDQRQWSQQGRLTSALSCRLRSSTPKLSRARAPETSCSPPLMNPLSSGLVAVDADDASRESEAFTMPCANVFGSKAGSKKVAYSTRRAQVQPEQDTWNEQAHQCRRRLPLAAD